jgi:uncharacterized protein
MRLAASEISAIKSAAHEAFGADVIVRLFGSRTDDSRRGGDIDLHFEIDPAIDEATAQQRFEDNLFARIDAQRVDIALIKRGAAARGIDLVARRDGIIL